MIAQVRRRLRGEILKLLYENHEAQRARMDALTLASVLESLKFDVHVNLVSGLLDDLKERGFVSFEKLRNRVTGELSIRQVQITPKGRDIVEKTGSSLAVEVD
jgi:DNA-binding MarR family transcriptional regulator